MHHLSSIHTYGVTKQPRKHVGAYGPWVVRAKAVEDARIHMRYVKFNEFRTDYQLVGTAAEATEFFTSSGAIETAKRFSDRLGFVQAVRKAFSTGGQ
jgi:hypothetical protein